MRPRRGERLELRKPVAADRDALGVLRDRSRGQWTPWEARSAAQPPESGRAWADRMVAAPEGRDFVRLAVVRHADATIVGLVTLGQIVLGPARSAFASWWIGLGHEGRGYGREAVGLLLDHAFRDLGLNRVEANIRTGNERSRRLAAAFGFRHEGLSPEFLEIDGAFRDHDRLAILRREWLARYPSGMHLTVVTDRPDLLVLGLEGRLDIKGASAIEIPLAARVNAAKRSTVFDLAKVDFLASMGMQLLVTSHRSLSVAGKRLVLLNPRPDVETALRLSRLDTVMAIVHDAAEAERLAAG